MHLDAIEACVGGLAHIPVDVAQLPSLFSSLDENHDGVLTEADLIKYKRQSRFAVAFKHMPSLHWPHLLSLKSANSWHIANSPLFPAALVFVCIGNVKRFFGVSFDNKIFKVVDELLASADDNGVCAQRWSRE